MAGKKGDAAIKKQLLLAMRPWCKRPRIGRHPLGTVLHSYTNRSNNMYDPIFARVIRERQPGWFRDCGGDPLATRQRLLELPVGCERPHQDYPLGRLLSGLTCHKDRRYDPEFDRGIRERQPGWWPADVKKRQLLAISPGAPKPYWLPNGKVDPLVWSLRHYTTKGRRSYDPEFDRAIRARQPAWFAFERRKSRV